MEFKNCEHYVLTELENVQKLNEKLQEQLEEKDLEIQALEMKLAEYEMKKESTINPQYVSMLETCFDDLTEIHDYYMALISRITDRFSVSKINGDYSFKFCGFPEDQEKRDEFYKALLEFKRIDIEKILFEGTDE